MTVIDHSDVVEDEYAGLEALPPEDPQQEFRNRQLLKLWRSLTLEAVDRHSTLLGELGVTEETADSLPWQVQRAAMELARIGNDACVAASILYQHAKN